MFRVIIAGGRDFNNYKMLKEAMDKLLSNIEDEIVVVSGLASGADNLGVAYACEKGYRIKSFPADWDKYGKQAGYIRNKEMTDNADALVAFWDGKSRGTKNMIDVANKNGLKVRVKRYD